MSSDIVPHAGGVVALTVDDDFRSLIPPLTNDEYMRLERSIIAEGVRDPIVTWQGTIIDGHNRYRICQEHGIGFKTAEVVFGSKDAAKIWIIETQFARRNLNSYQKSVLALQLEPLYAAEAKRNSEANLQHGSVAPERQKSDSRGVGRTDERLAQIAGVSRDTIRKVKAIETEAAKGNEAAIEARQKLMDGGSSSINGAYVAVTGDMKPRTKDESSTTDGRRICSICGEPINEGDCYHEKRNLHYKCGLARAMEIQRRYRDPDKTLSSNVAVFTPMTLLAELSQSADEFGRSVRQSLDINEENGAALTRKQKGRIIKAVDAINEVINAIAEEYRNA